MTGDQDGRTSMRAAMLEATAGADPDINALIHGGRRRAAALRRRRTSRTVGGVLAVALVAAGTTAVVGRWGPAAPDPADTGPTVPKGPAAVGSPAWVYGNFKTLLPAGGKLRGERFEDLTSTVPETSLGALGGITISEGYEYDDGHGPVQLVLNIDSGGADTFAKLRGRTTCGVQSAGADSCQVRQLPDGSVGQISQIQPSGAVKRLFYRAAVYRPNGTIVELDEIAGDMRSDGTMNPMRPMPLSLDQLITVADDAAWDPLGPLLQASIPVPLGPTGFTTPPSGAPSVQPIQLAQVLKGLLPAGVVGSTDDPGLNQDVGTGKVLLHDPRGDVRLEVTNAFTPIYACGADPQVGEDQCHDVTLPDGTAIQLRHFVTAPAGSLKPFGAGVQGWQATAVRHDGVAVQVTEYNAADPAQAATRTDAPLSLAQLQAIVASPAWDAFRGQNPPDPGLTPKPAPKPSPQSSPQPSPKPSH